MTKLLIMPTLIINGRSVSIENAAVYQTVSSPSRTGPLDKPRYGGSLYGSRFRPEQRPQNDLGGQPSHHNFSRLIRHRQRRRLFHVQSKLDEHTSSRQVQQPDDNQFHCRSNELRFLRVHARHCIDHRNLPRLC